MTKPAWPWIVGAGLLLTSPVQSAEPEIEPGHVFAKVTDCQHQIERIRLEMGKPETLPLRVEVNDAEPREVYYQALTLLAKANRLSYELTGTDVPVPDPPEELIEPKHVFEVVDAALERFLHAQEVLGIRPSELATPHEPGREPTDVFNAILETNRQLNFLLDTPFSPADVFQQVTAAVGYAASLLSAYTGAQQIPDTPPLERPKRPVDVYRRLLECVHLTEQIVTASDQKMLALVEQNIDFDEVTPSDVFDLASLILSELSYLYSVSPSLSAPLRAYDPGRKFPSHVFQRAGILQAQLKNILAQHKIVE